jgi:hypothetical protein
VELNEEYKELLCTLCSAKAATVSAMYQHLHGERHRKKALTQKVEDVIWIKERNQLESLGLFLIMFFPAGGKKAIPCFILVVSGVLLAVSTLQNLMAFGHAWLMDSLRCWSFFNSSQRGVGKAPTFDRSWTAGLSIIVCCRRVSHRCCWSIHHSV